MRRFLLYIFPVVAYAGVIFLLSSQPTLPAPKISNFDKVAHFTVYAGLGLLAARGMQGYGAAPGGAAVFGAVLASFYGASDELHQHFVPGRSADIWDLVADVLGGICGALVWYGLSRWRR